MKQIINEKGGFLPAITMIIAPLAIDLLSKLLKWSTPKRWWWSLNINFNAKYGNRTAFDSSRSVTYVNATGSRHEIHHGFSVARRSKNSFIGTTHTEISRIEHTNLEWFNNFPTCCPTTSHRTNSCYTFNVYLRRKDTYNPTKLPWPVARFVISCKLPEHPILLGTLLDHVQK